MIKSYSPEIIEEEVGSAKLVVLLHIVSTIAGVIALVVLMKSLTKSVSQ